MEIDHAAAERRAAAWAHAWNARDIEAVLAHLRDDVTFRSPVAVQVVGTPTLRGKEALRRYWAAALELIRRLHFTVDRALWDTERRELALFYVAEIDDRCTRACGRMRLDEASLVVEAEAQYGAPLPAAQTRGVGTDRGA